MAQTHVCGRGPTPELPPDELAPATGFERPVAVLARPQRRPQRRAVQLVLALPQPSRRGRREAH